jgi:hypothetical protein
MARLWSGSLLAGQAMLGWVSGPVQRSLGFGQFAGMWPIVEEIPLESASVGHPMTTSSAV